MSRPLLKLLLLLARLPTTELLLPWDWPSSLSLSRAWLATEVGGGTVEGAELSAAQIPLHFLFRSTHGHIVQVFFLFPTSLILFVYMKSEFFKFFGLLA
jgi:hypothetical protein